jgi:hypothetical protein
MVATPASSLRQAWLCLSFFFFILQGHAQLHVVMDLMLSFIHLPSLLFFCFMFQLLSTTHCAMSATIDAFRAMPMKHSMLSAVVPIASAAIRACLIFRDVFCRLLLLMVTYVSDPVSRANVRLHHTSGSVYLLQGHARLHVVMDLMLSSVHFPSLLLFCFMFRLLHATHCAMPATIDAFRAMPMKRSMFGALVSVALAAGRACLVFRSVFCRLLLLMTTCACHPVLPDCVCVHHAPPCSHHAMQEYSKAARALHHVSLHLCSCISCLLQKTAVRLRGLGLPRGLLAAACVTCLFRLFGLYIGMTVVQLDARSAVLRCVGDARTRDYLLTQVFLLLLLCGCSLHAP